MSINQINKFLTVAMGGCVHSKYRIGYNGHDKYAACLDCREVTTKGKNDTPIWTYRNFSAPDGFFKLWNWAQTQEWWALFTLMDVDPDECHNYITLMSGTYFHTEAINPEKFATAVYEFLKEQG